MTRNVVRTKSGRESGHFFVLTKNNLFVKYIVYTHIYTYIIKFWIMVHLLQLEKSKQFLMFLKRSFVWRKILHSRHRTVFETSRIVFYLLGCHECTLSQFLTCMDDEPSHFYIQQPPFHALHLNLIFITII